MPAGWNDGATIRAAARRRPHAGRPAAAERGATDGDERGSEMTWGATSRLPVELHGRRVMLRGLAADDFEQWRDVRRRCREWLTKWEPRSLPGQPDPTEDRRAFAARCNARERERQLGSGYGFGIFVDDRFHGEINLSGIQRGPFQNAYVGYWIAESVAGH